MMKHEYKVINQPLSLRHRVAQPESDFSADEIIGGEDEIKFLLAEKRIEKIDISAEGGPVNAEIERLSDELTDALVKNEGLNAEIEKLNAMSSKQGMKELKAANAALTEENEALKAEIEKLKSPTAKDEAAG